MPNGYNGRILRVDLSAGKTWIEEPPEQWYRTYLGGSGIVGYYLLKELVPGIDPLHEDNLLIFASNVISGAPVSGFSRFTVGGKSPLTNAFGESEAGGWWGPELKLAGFDAVVIRGRAASPVYLWLHNDEAEIRDAAHLWGLGNGDTRDRILKDLGDERVRIASIGPAGEHLVRFACIINELRHANGRTGMGALMGSKNLKAIAVRGKKKMTFARPAEVASIAKWHNERIKVHLPNIGWHQFGTPGLVPGLNAAGIFPTRNFSDGSFEGAGKIDGQAMIDTILEGRETCYACAVRCKRVVSCEEPYKVDRKFGGPEYETLASLGSLCGIDSLPAIAKGHQLCNDMGMDTISAGALVGFTMDCFEKGILHASDAGGAAYRFGDADAMLGLLNDIAFRNGLGDLLAEGVRIAAERIGGGAERLAFHAKGQEVAMHDPRGKTSVALSYALSPTGADHIEAQHETAFQTRTPVFGQLAPLGIHEPMDIFSLAAEKVRNFTILQRVWSLYNSIGICNFVAAPTYALTFPKLVEVISAITGWETSLWELLRAGERANVMARMFNIREGITGEADTIPAIFFDPLPSGTAKGKRIDRTEFRKALELYYDTMGWDRDGKPTRGKLVDLALDWLL